MGKNTKAAQAMRYMRSAGVTLKQAWAHVKGGRGKSPAKRAPAHKLPVRAHGGGHTAKKGLFGLGLPKVGEMIQGAYIADRFGAFTALDTLTNVNSTDNMNTRLKNAGNHVIGKVTSVGNIVTTIITSYILNVGIKVARKVGGKFTRGWL